MDKYVATGRIHFDGRPFEPGELIPFSGDQGSIVDQLLELGRIEPASEVHVLGSMSVKQLRELATAENVELPERAKPPEIVKAVLTARSERAAAVIAGDQDGQKASK